MPDLLTASTPESILLTPELPFARKYTTAHALRYFEKHQAGLGRRLSNWREITLTRKALALAGQPKSVLDIPCGTGRFWELLAEEAGRVIYGADLNLPMIETALEMRPAEVVARVEAFSASAFAIPRPDDFVESVLCMRLLHHIQDAEHRLQILKELARVCSQTVVVSLWTDGNYKAWRWQVRGCARGHANRFLVPHRVAEAEFAQSGLRVVRRLHLIRFHSMWTIYLLAKV
jgi:ubiquinone/menaquinone biosynthesis C-methylase UbiE